MLFIQYVSPMTYQQLFFGPRISVYICCTGKEIYIPRCHNIWFTIIQQYKIYMVWILLQQPQQYITTCRSKSPLCVAHSKYFWYLQLSCPREVWCNFMKAFLNPQQSGLGRAIQRKYLYEIHGSFKIHHFCYKWTLPLVSTVWHIIDIQKLYVR